MQPYQHQLAQGLEALGCISHFDKLNDYLLLLVKWNQAYNLTAIRDLSAMVDKHILDSLAIMPFIDGSSLIDVGSGAGLPGIPLAIAKPELRVTLLDSNGKKTQFLRTVKRNLVLDNVDIVSSRAELYQPNTPYDCVVSRAFSDLASMLQYTNHLVATDGYWLAMKGHIPKDELVAVHKPHQVIPYSVPFAHQSRCVIKITQS